MEGRQTKPPGKVHPRGVPTGRPAVEGDLSGAWTLEPIGWFESPFHEKFGIPRQSGMVQGARGFIRLRDHDFLAQALKGLESFSHLWALWIFHEHDARDWKPSIRPPRLGGAKRVGVLASRSPHRPNPIGMSALKILSIDPKAKGGPRIEVEGLDVIDGTPVIDLKPYVPYADCFPEATSGWAAGEIPRTPVEFSEEARALLAAMPGGGADLERLIVGVVELDPRPASLRRREPSDSQAALGSRHGFELKGWDVRWEITPQGFRVRELVPLNRLG